MAGISSSSGTSVLDRIYGVTKPAPMPKEGALTFDDLKNSSRLREAYALYKMGISTDASVNRLSRDRSYQKPLGFQNLLNSQSFSLTNKSFSSGNASQLAAAKSLYASREQTGASVNLVDAFSDNQPISKNGVTASSGSNAYLAYKSTSDTFSSISVVV
jgi:hypothetical protein